MARGGSGPQALSVATRQRLLADLLHRAEAGDAEAAGVLIKLSIAAEQMVARGCHEHPDCVRKAAA